MTGCRARVNIPSMAARELHGGDSRAESAQSFQLHHNLVFSLLLLRRNNLTAISAIKSTLVISTAHVGLDYKTSKPSLPIINSAFNSLEHIQECCNYRGSAYVFITLRYDGTFRFFE